MVNMTSQHVNMTSEIFVCELLCFLRKNFDKLTVSRLKPVIVSFYKDDELVNAKDILLKVVVKAAEAAGVDLDLPRMPKRHGDNKCKQTADDLLKLMTVADERNLWDALPRFVAEDLDRIPFINSDSMSLINMARKMEMFEQRLINMECSVDNISGKASVKSIVDFAAQSSSIQVPTDAAFESVGACPDVSCILDENQDKRLWTEVVKKVKRKNVVTMPSGSPSVAGDLSGPVQNLRSDGSLSASMELTELKPDQQKGRCKVVGTKVNGIVSALKPGITIVKKTVVHIDNLDPDCTEALLKEYLLSSDINVLSCYKVKSWLRENERDKVTAFRVCVPANQHQRIFDSQLWSQGVIIRDWQFKKSSNGGSS